MGCSSSNDAYVLSSIAAGRPPILPLASKQLSIENKANKTKTELIKIEYFSIMGRADPLV